MSGPKRPGRKAPQRVPAWMVIPLTTAVGYVVAQIPGGVFGLVAGLFLWWSRR